MTNEEINLAVAAIAGWTEIELWSTYKPEDNSPNPLRVYQGTNAAHPELGKFIPKYTESLDAIVALLDELNLNYEIMRWGAEHKKAGKYFIVFENHKPDYQDVNHPFYPWYDNLSLGLCKLLLAINPTPIAPPQVAIIDDDGEHD
jgi:hypothetical protein